MNYSQRPQTELQKLPAGTILSSFVSESTVNILESHFTGREDKGKRKSVRQRTALLPPRGDLKHAHDTCVLCSSPSSHPTVTSYFIQLCNSSFWGMAVPTITLVAVLSALPSCLLPHSENTSMQVSLLFPFGCQASHHHCVHLRSWEQLSFLLPHPSMSHHIFLSVSIN